MPVRIEITPGTEVRWTNRGVGRHDVVPVERSDWGVSKEDFPPGATYSHIFGGVGEVPYYCTVHGKPGFGMIGTIVVVDQVAGRSLPAKDRAVSLPLRRGPAVDSRSTHS